MKVFLAILASGLMLLLGSASETVRQVVDPVHSPDLFSPQGVMSAAQRPNMQNAVPTHFELPTTPGAQTKRVHYLGFCGSLQKDAWKGGRWVALTVLANIAVGLFEEFAEERELGPGLIEAFPQFAEQRELGPIRWLLTAGTEPSEEVEQAVRMVRFADILIGCSSTSTTEAIASEVVAARTPMISPTPFVGSGDDFPYFFRTSPSESDIVKGFMEICKHFGWNRVGLLYQQPRLWSMVQSVQNSEKGYPLVDPFFFVDEGVIANVSKSHLRVLGLAAPYSPVAMNILRSQSVFDRDHLTGNESSFTGIMNRQWIVFDDEIWQAMSSFERRAWSGMMHLGAMDNSCCTQKAKKMEAMWHTMSWQTLIDHKVPKSIVTRMQQENRDLFQQSPWQAKGAFFFDAILMALLAFKLDAKNHEAAPLDRVLRHIRLTGVSGFLTEKKHAEARMNLTQLRAGAWVPVADLFGMERFVVTNQVIFPNGGSDPRSYDYKPPVNKPPVDLLAGEQAASRDYHTVQYHASGDGQQVTAKIDWGSTIMKTLIGCVVVVLVCIALPYRHDARGWARTVTDLRHPGGQSERLSTSQNDEEIADEVTE